MKKLFILATATIAVLSACKTTPIISPNLVIEQSSHGEEHHYLRNVEWKPLWVSQLAAIKSSLAYYDKPTNDGWLFGVSGYAFIMNINERVTTDCPTHFDSTFILSMARNLGVDFEYIKSNKSLHDFNIVQRKAWKFAKSSINQGYPCIAWAIERPEFYIVTGYDNFGYYYAGPLNPKVTGPFKWQKLGKNADNILFLGAMKPCEIEDDKEIILEALLFAQAFSTTRRWVKDGYSSGLEAYDLWIKALESGDISASGNAYNASVWNQCRSEAVVFLNEAKKKFPVLADKEFDQAIRSYKTITYNFGQLALEFPYLNTSPEDRQLQIKDTLRVARGVENLKNARRAEKEAMQAMDALIKKLSE